MLLSAILLCLYCSLIIDFSIIDPFKKIAFYLSQLCQSHFDHSLLSAQLNQSLVCGTKLSGSNMAKNYFTQLGVVHLLIASGAHLHFLKSCLLLLLKKIPAPEKIKRKFINSILLLYVAVSGFNPPLLRAFISLSSKQCSKIHKLHWGPSIALLISIVASLLVQPKLWSSYSLILSWVVCSVLLLHQKPLKKCITIYIFSLPVLVQFQWVHPISIFTNLFFAPIFSVLHFPLSFLSLFFNEAALMSEHVWAITLDVFKRIQQNISTSKHKLEIPNYYLSAYCFLLQIYVMWKSVEQKRKYYFT